ncbi:Ig-like domain-containing protein [Calderihabitans maritimus]|uniref:Cytochrome C family protein n=1 Tax=Calderihabitans maritimus TaxID=1246530 RepID=A0A1Z5HW83_9FIRM|nr:Ig-like domain-containing protein [Calderihabitans maritimus]GAW93591.1 cytochrome C family protein [Calderihabitans maritimus]
MRGWLQAYGTVKKLFPGAKQLAILLLMAGIALSNPFYARAATTGALYPGTATYSGTIYGNANDVLADDGTSVGVDSADSSLTVSGFSMGNEGDINSIIFYWDITDFTGTVDDDVIYLEYSYDNGTSWNLAYSYTTSTFPGPGLISYPAGDVPVGWTNVDIANVQMRIRTVAEPNANKADGVVIYADVFYIDVDYTAASDTEPPTWPSSNSLSVTAAGSTQIDLSWTNDASDNVGVDHWEVWRSTTAGGPYTLIDDTLPAGSSSYSDTTVTGGNTYYYVVRVVDAAGNYTESNEASDTTPSGTTATTGALYPTSATPSGTVSNPDYVLADDGTSAGVDSADSSLTASGFSMGNEGDINSITFYWDITGFTGTVDDDEIYLEYSYDNGTSWNLAYSYTTSTFPGPGLISYPASDVPVGWTSTDITNVQMRIRTVAKPNANQADGVTIYADVFYIDVEYTPFDTEPPNWPSSSSLAANAVGPAQVDLTWTNDATDNVGVTGWEIYRKLSSEATWPGTPIDTAPAGASSYSDTTVSPETSYDYKIRAKDGGGNTSSWSNVASATTPPDTTAPGWPSSNSLTASAVSGSQVDLSWTNDATDNVGVTGWEIYRKLSSEGTWPGTPIDTAPAGASSYSDTTVNDNTGYDYRIRAVDAAGNGSVWSNTASVTTPDETPPVVVSELPASGSANVLRGTLIKVTFNEPMDTTTFDINTTFRIHDDTNNVYITGGTLTFENGDKTAVFDSTDPLAANAAFTVTVTTGVTDAAGNNLAADYSWSFQTGTDIFKTPHGGFATNDDACGRCHTTHAGIGSDLMRAGAVDQLCYLCHDAGGTGSIYTVEDDFDTVAKASTHKVPASQQCNDCHNPHLDAGTVPKLLETSTGQNSDEQYCWTCHGTGSTLSTDSGTDPAGNANDHQSYYPQDGTGHDDVSLEPSSGTLIKCLGCHEEHGSDFTKLLQVDPNGDSTNITGNDKSFCYECHTGAIAGADSAWDGKIVNDSGGHTQNCTVCHDPHGTPNDDHYTIFPYSMTPVGTSRDNTNYPYNSNDFKQCWDGSCHVGTDTQLTQTTKNADNTAPTGFWQEDLYNSNPSDERVNLHNFHLNLDQYRPGRGNAVCKECHRPHGPISSENPDLKHRVGFPSSTVAANSLANPQYDHLDSGAGDPNDGGTCDLTCHGYVHTNVTYNNGGAGGGTVSSGGQDCSDGCHSNTLVQDMGTSSTMYRHQVTSPAATYDGETVGPGETTCLSLCHTDHDIFNSQIGTEASPFLREYGGNTSIPPSSGIPASQANTLCLSSACHGTAGGIDDPNYNSPSGYAGTSDIAAQVNRTQSGWHPIAVPLPGTANDTGNPYVNSSTMVSPWDQVQQLKCTDCHTQEAAPLGPHASSNRYMLKKLGPTSTAGAFELYDALCTMCHDSAVYGYGGTPGSGSGSKAASTHSQNNHYDGRYGCMGCHGGNPEFAVLAGDTAYNPAAERGSIHGWEYTYPGAGAPAAGFVNGLYISNYDPSSSKPCTAQTGNDYCSMAAKSL